jgi:hypothetical protein
MENNIIWKDIINFEGIYKISTKGEILNIRTNKILEPNKSGRYLYYSLSKNAKPLYRYLHRMIAQCFIENIDNKPQVNHIDGNRRNNKIENLEWATASENITHAYKNKLIKHTEKQRKFCVELGKKNAKYILCTQTGIFYESCTEASKLLLNKYKSIQSAQASLSAMLLGKIINKTSFIYV